MCAAHVSGELSSASASSAASRSVACAACAAREAPGGAADGERLEREARLVDLGEVGDRELGHAGAAVGDVLDEAGAVEPAQRLSDRHRAHPERLAELLDREPLAGRELAGDDRVVERAEGPVGERAVRRRHALEPEPAAAPTAIARRPSARDPAGRCSEPSKTVSGTLEAARRRRRRRPRCPACTCRRRRRRSSRAGASTAPCPRGARRRRPRRPSGARSSSSRSNVR